MKKLKIFALVAVLIFSITACSSKTEKTSKVDEKVKTEQIQKKDMLYVGQGRVVSDVDPINSSWQLTTHGVSEYVYKVDKDGKLQSRFLDELKKESELRWSATVKKDVKFSDGSVVDAKALADAMNYIQEKNELSNATAGKIKFIADEGRLIIETKRPTNVMSSILAEWTNVVFKKAGDDFIYTGPFKVDKLIPNEEIDMSPNQYYKDADKRTKVTVKAFKDEASMKSAFLSGEIDMIFPITPDLKNQLEKENKITKTIDAGYQYFMLANIQKDLMKDINFRRALDLSFNREDYTKALSGGNIPTGLFAHYYSFAGNIKPQFDCEKANAMLDELGWKKNSDGIREKDGKKLTLNIATLSFRKDLVILGQIVTSQLKNVGIDAVVEALDSAENLDGKSKYDILLYSQHTAPTGEPSYFLNQFFRTGEAKNRFGYSNKEVDKMLDNLGKQTDIAKRDEIAKNIQAKIQEDLPVFLVIDPMWHGAVSDYLKNYEFYCGDYFVVNENFGIN